jgi:hypothetical protein
LDSRIRNRGMEPETYRPALEDHDLHPQQIFSHMIYKLHLDASQAISRINCTRIMARRDQRLYGHVGE